MALPLAIGKARAGPVLRADVNGDDVPIGGLLNVDAAGVLAQVAGGQPLAPDVVQGAAHAGGALDDDVTVRQLLGEDAQGRDPLPRHVLQLLGRAKAGDRELRAVEVVPDGGDVGTAVRADCGQGGDMRLAEEGFDVCGDRYGHGYFRLSGAPAFYRAGKGGVKRIRSGQVPAIMALHWCFGPHDSDSHFGALRDPRAPPSARLSLPRPRGAELLLQRRPGRAAGFRPRPHRRRKLRAGDGTLPGPGGWSRRRRGCYGCGHTTGHAGRADNLDERDREADPVVEGACYRLR